VYRRAGGRGATPCDYCGVACCGVESPGTVWILRQIDVVGTTRQKCFEFPRQIWNRPGGNLSEYQSGRAAHRQRNSVPAHPYRPQSNGQTMSIRNAKKKRSNKVCGGHSRETRRAGKR
jgi:hypothetical protein